MQSSTDDIADAHRSIDATGVSASGSPLAGREADKALFLSVQLLELAANTATSALIRQSIPLASSEAYSEEPNVRL